MSRRELIRLVAFGLAVLVVTVGIYVLYAIPNYRECREQFSVRYCYRELVD